MKWFWGFLRKYRFKLLGGLILTTFISVLAIVNPYVSGMIVDDVIQGGQYDLLWKLVLILLFVTLVRGALRFFYQVIFEVCSQGVLYDMRDVVYRRLLTEDFAFYSKKKTGDLMSRQTGDMEAIRHFVAYIIYQVYENILLFCFALFMIFTVNVKLALCMLIVLPFTAITTAKQSKEVRPTFQRIRDCFSSLNAFVQENVSGNRVVKAFAKEDFEIEKFNKENDAYMDAQLNSSKVWMKYLPIFEVLAYVLNVVLMLYGGWMVITGEMTIGNLVTVNGYLWMLNTPLRMAGWWVNDIQNFVTSVEKIYATYSEEPKVAQPRTGGIHKKIMGNVEFKNVSYSADDEDIVKDISFSVKKGQTVGILGSTGAGKSTIISMVSAAKPKIADYHFTTLAPILGVVDAKAGGYVLADIPGLIEGASEGIGLGHEFLKHIERTKVLIHMVDAASTEGRDPIDDINKINAELKAYNPDLMNRPQVIAANKIDAIYDGDESIVDKLKAEFEPKGIKVFGISAVSGKGLKELLYAVNDMLEQMDSTPVVFEQEYFPGQFSDNPDDPYTVEKVEDGLYSIEGPRIEKMLGYTNLEAEKGFIFFQKFMKDNGILEELENLGIQEGDTVKIYGHEFEYYK